MELSIVQFLIACPLTFLAGLVDAIAGGGGLISLPAILLAGVPAHLALGTNKLCSVFGTATSAWRFTKHGYVQLKKVLWFIPVSLVGSVLGTELTLHVNEKIVEYMMILILPIVAFYVLKNKKIGCETVAGTIPPKKAFLIALLLSFVLGTYDGFYGPGSGTFLILTLSGAAKFSMREAAGTTKIINLASNVASLVVFILNGKVIFSLGLATAACCALGNFIGAGMVLHGAQKIVRPMVLVVLSILFLKIIFG